ncbi:MAG: M23 family metallopeptidase [Chloroflexota bacterium]
MQQRTRRSAGTRRVLPLGLLLLLLALVTAAGIILALTANQPPAPAAIPVSPSLPPLTLRAQERALIGNSAPVAVAAPAAAPPAFPPLSARDPQNVWFSLPLAWPTRGDMTTLFWEEGPYWIGGHHQGIDLAAKEGTAVRAASAGIVLAANPKSSRGYGTHIVLDHGYGVQTLYAHLSAMAVEPGQRVARGEPIGAVGNTGYSFGAHLHFEVHVDGNLTNPLLFLPDFPKRGLLSTPHSPRME